MSDRIVIVIFKVAGCEACAEYVPRFRRLAKPFKDRFPMHVIDANAPKQQALADRFKIHEVPVTMILKKPSSMLRYEGSLDDAQILQILRIAAAHA